MTEEIDDIGLVWKAAKRSPESNTPSIESLIGKANANKRSALQTQYGNMAILAAVLSMVALFLYYLYPLPNVLSQLGTHLMTGGLAMRIVIELISVFKSNKIDVTDTALKATEDAVKLYKYRNFINGPVTISTVVLYSTGFFLWSQGLSPFIDAVWLVLLGAIYLTVAVILIWLIRKGIRKEMDDLAELIQLKKEMIVNN